MGLFDKLKKKKDPHYDSTNIRVNDLDVGYVFDYDLSTWEVKAVYDYDWGSNHFTAEYKISDGSKTLFLSVEEDDELEISISKKIKLGMLGEAVVEDVMEKQKPPTKIEYDGRIYFLEKEAPGYFNDPAKGTEEWDELIAWEYEDEPGEHILNIEQWGEREFEASAGKVINDYEITNILPAQD